MALVAIGNRSHYNSGDKNTDHRRRTAHRARHMDWHILLSTFGLIFVAELGDKTQLAVVTQTCKYRRPWAVFLGASTALTAVTLLGVIGGQLLGQAVHPSVLRTTAALAFVVMGILVAREALKARASNAGSELACDHADGHTSNADTDCTPASARDWKAFGATLGLLFVAELGDKTQLAVFSLTGKCAAPESVFLGGALALILVTALGVVGGQRLCKLVPERLLLWISALVFVSMGVLMGFGVL